jgi:nucleoside 2-deoxyribosyltransferase
MLIPIYPASPLGFSEGGRFFYEKQFLPLLVEIGFQPLDPWRMTDQCLLDEASATPYGIEQREKWRFVNQIIGRNNTEAIQKSAILVAVLDGVDVDSGTASEVGYGAALGKPVIGYRGDFRLSADNVGSTVNLQVEYFIRLHGGEVVTTLVELRSVLVRWHEMLRNRHP